MRLACPKSVIFRYFKDIVYSVTSNGDYRPLLPVDNFAAVIDKLHNERDSLYEQVASFSLSSDNGDIEEHAASILRAMKK